MAKRPTPFLLQHPSQKEKGMTEMMFIAKFTSHNYSWLVDGVDAKMALDGQGLIDEDKVECMPDKVPNAIVDDSVDVHLVRRYFTSNAWMIIQDVIRRKKECAVWTCNSCYKDLDEQQSIACESYLEWFHFSCVGLAKKPKAKNWFCRQCFASCKI